MVTRTRFLLILGVSVFLLLLACVVGVGIGAVNKSLEEVISGLLAGEKLYWRYRVPRIVVGILAGVGMAVSGCLLQVALRNPLAAPDTLGITAGGGLAAVLALLGFGQLPPLALTPIAFVGSLLGALAVFIVAGKDSIDPARLALIGVAVSVGLAAMTQLLLVRVAPEAGAAMTWLKGSLYARTMRDAMTVAPVLTIGLITALILARHFNALALEDSLMASIGVRAPLLRVLALVIAIACGAAAVAVAGVLGFVGLIIPHAARILVGQNLVRQIPVAAVVGAGLVVVADAIGRWAFAPTEIPAGALIAIAGAPYFMYLVHRVTTIKRR